MKEKKSWEVWGLNTTRCPWVNSFGGVKFDITDQNESLNFTLLLSEGED